MRWASGPIPLRYATRRSITLITEFVPIPCPVSDESRPQRNSQFLLECVLITLPSVAQAVAPSSFRINILRAFPMWRLCTSFPESAFLIVGVGLV
jgi:hypothetical protein